jgi:hypothetical protein
MIWGDGLHVEVDPSLQWLPMDETSQPPGPAEEGWRANGDRWNPASRGWDPRSWGLIQVLGSAMVILALPVFGLLYGPQLLRQAFFFVELAAIGLLSRFLATRLRRRYRPPGD